MPDPTGPASRPSTKVRERFGRLWGHLRDAIALVDEAFVYDNTSAAAPFRLVATFIGGRLAAGADWPRWTPGELRTAGH